MAHRRRPKPEPIAPSPPSARARLARGINLFLAENVRGMLLFFGTATLAQAFLPWTNDAMDRIVFAAVGAVMLGFAVPRRLWVR